MTAYSANSLFTPAEYLELERSAETKSEYHNGVIVAMAGSTEEHDLAIGDIYISIGAQLRGSQCKFYTDNMRVNVPECNCYYYPDASVACGEPQFQRIDGVQSLTNPILIVEVLSESTERFDRDRKFFCYQTLPSLKTYILVSQDEPLVQVFEKQSDSKWVFEHYEGLEAIVPLPSIGCELKLADVYSRVEFKPEAENAALRIMEERARYSEQGASGPAVGSQYEEVHSGSIR
jgi:Uma2 family endonuclease